MNSPRDHGIARSFNFGALLTASAIAAAVFRRARGDRVHSPGAQAVHGRRRRTPSRSSFGYSAHVARRPVYPDRTRSTPGDPIFLSLVHQTRRPASITALSGAAPTRISGHRGGLPQADRPERLDPQLSCSHPPTHFTGDHTSTEVTLDIRAAAVAAHKVGALTGGLASASYTIAVEPQVHVTGTVAGHPIEHELRPGAERSSSATRQLVSNGASAATQQRRRRCATTPGQGRLQPVCAGQRVGTPRAPRRPADHGARRLARDHAAALDRAARPAAVRPDRRVRVPAQARRAVRGERPASSPSTAT